ncbi:type IV secretory system conjugative DNA transfer family protein [Agrobacterium fabrum]|uniref:type IV secretion system DNA-binding domain-containing protein n=1 Tax=Agrobacterium fabrum TaxID=1176649 RepID=UPI000EF5B83A|nr:type IV secretion system DNA-binding domain-containing protein [Agrobacterium fabrum]AYM66209.1 type IV secretory system conjugative DNA transfer family protein [Agrobacterium fabrum]NTE63955.1 type IV secretory system conjugative DNA transfer family protein [Agrobacterium fabrum]
MKKFITKLAAKALTWNDRVFASSRNPLLRGDLVEYGRESFPPEHYQTMWMDIPQDLDRDILWDGRFLNGAMPAELAKARFDDELISTMLVQSGKKALWITGVIGVVVALMTVSNFGVVFTGQTAYPTWAAESGVWLPIAAWYVLTVIERVGGVLGAISMSSAMLLPLLLLFPVVWWWAFARYMQRMWHRISMPYRMPSSDTQHYWKAHIENRIDDYEAYKRQIAEALRIADKPLIVVGEATGKVKVRGDNAAPLPGQVVCLDGESIRQHVLILGGTGSGKTRMVIKPLFKRIMNADWGAGHKMGAYVTDGKGTLWKDLYEYIKHRPDVKIIGTEEGQFGIDIVEGMSPLEVSTTLNAVYGQVLGGKSDGDFWRESASILIMHAATVARILDRIPSVVDEWKKTHRVRPYSLLGIHLISTEPYYTNIALKTFREHGPGYEQKFGVDTPEMIEAVQSAKWFYDFFLVMAPNTRDGIIANLNVVLGKLRGSREVAERFCSGNFKNSVDVDHALKGGVVLVAISETEFGMAGKVVTVWLKTRLYIMARRRMLADPEACKTTSCAMFADEFQMLATASGGESDADTWNWARESGLFLVASTQNLAALNRTMGETATANLVTLLRTKIILETEEKGTVAWAEQISGKLPWGWATNPRFYSTQYQRMALIGNNTSLAKMSFADGLLPSMFLPIVDQVMDGWGAKMLRVPAAMLGMNRHDSEGIDKYTVHRSEQDEFERATIPDQEMPKIRQSDLLTGSGYAFAMVRRANTTRLDMIDLRIED